MGKRPCAVLLGFAAAGTVTSLMSSAVSLLSATGNVPSFLLGSTQQFTTFYRIKGVPIEFLVAAAFAASFLLLWAMARRGRPNVYAHAFVLGTALLGATGSLALNRPNCPMFWVMSGCAMSMLLVGVFADPRSPRDTIVSVIADFRTGLLNTRTLSAAAIYVLTILLVAQSIAHRVAAATPSESNARNLERWFKTQSPIALQEFRAAHGRRLVIFTDYECPVCSVLIPQYRSVVVGLRNTGYEIDLTIRDFPLARECNASVRATQHPLACEAAVAMRLLVARRPSQVEEFETWLYEQKGRLTIDGLKAKLEALGLARAFTADYATLLSEVTQDARLGQQAGVYATPTVFLDGVKLPNLLPPGLETLLAPSRQLPEP